MCKIIRYFVFQIKYISHGYGYYFTGVLISIITFISLYAYPYDNIL